MENITHLITKYENEIKTLERIYAINKKRWKELIKELENKEKKLLTLTKKREIKSLTRNITLISENKKDYEKKIRLNLCTKTVLNKIIADLKTI